MCQNRRYCPIPPNGCHYCCCSGRVGGHQGRHTGYLGSAVSSFGWPRQQSPASTKPKLRPSYFRRGVDTTRRDSPPVFTRSPIVCGQRATASPSRISSTVPRSPPWTRASRTPKDRVRRHRRARRPGRGRAFPTAWCTPGSRWAQCRPRSSRRTTGRGVRAGIRQRPCRRTGPVASTVAHVPLGFAVVMAQLVLTPGPDLAVARTCRWESGSSATGIPRRPRSDPPGWH